MLRLSGTGASHTGLVRGHNEDAGFVGPDLVLVADGVGGAAAGEVASATTAFAVCAMAMQRRGEDPRAVLDAGVRRAQQLLAHDIEQDPARAGMASTLTALLTDGARFALAQIGDSRAYALRDDELIRVTRDHTWVAESVEKGRLTEDEARVHPWCNVLVRSVNGDDDAEAAEVLPLALRPGDRVLLASDGLTDLVPEERIEEVLRHYDDDSAVETLVSDALGRGGIDNVTCVVATVVEGPQVDSRGRLLGALLDPRNVVDPEATGTAMHIA